jgi:uncharacterized protein YlxP (DUF503 family)
MLVGVNTWDLQLPGCQSLKDKRGVIRPLTTRLRNQFNVSVAETAHQDSWQRAEIACAAVASDKRVLDQTLRAADQLVERADGVRIIDATAVYR